MSNGRNGLLDSRVLIRGRSLGLDGSQDLSGRTPGTSPNLSYHTGLSQATQSEKSLPLCEMSDYGDSDDGSGCDEGGWQPKESSLRSPEEYFEVATEPFECCGTKRRNHNSEDYNCMYMVSADQRERVGRHVVAIAPAKKWVKRSWVEVSTPSSRDTEYKYHFKGKCDSCYTQDKEGDEADRVADNFYMDLADQADRAEQEGFKQKRKEKVKEQIGEKKRKAHAEMQQLTPSKTKKRGEGGSGTSGGSGSGSGSGSGIAAALEVFKDQLKTLHMPLLKELCVSNHLMVSSGKEELLMRLVRCRLHGHAGACPACGYSKLQLIYPTQTQTQSHISSSVASVESVGSVGALAVPIGERERVREGMRGSERV
jgi:hypothetical protein